MSYINVFRIDENKVEDLQAALEILGTPHTKDFNLDDNNITATLYVKNETYKCDVKWQWVLDEFSAGSVQKEKQAWSVVLAKVGESTYVLTFGNAFYHIDKFSDKNFAFAIGKKFSYKQIKSTAQANPNSNRNKTVVSYLDNKFFEYDSGESFLKIKAKINLPEDFSLFKESLEIGSSLKLDIENPTILKCLQALNYLNDCMQLADITSIPVFVKVKNREFIGVLEERLQNNFENDELDIVFADFDIIGTQEIFYGNVDVLSLKYGHNFKKVECVNENTLRDFCTEKNLDYSKIALSIKITATIGEQDWDCIVKDLIDYTDEEHKCILIRGDWYQYNEDYLRELENSLAEFEITENPDLDWTNELYDEFISKKFEQEHTEEKYASMNDAQIQADLKRKYYAERAYNEYLSVKLGYDLLDRKYEEVQGQKVEVADLYKDECLIAVKIGNSSSKLCYAIDQITASAKMIKNRTLPFDKKVKKFAVLFVLQRDKLPCENGKIDINKLHLLVLKNKLNNFKKEIRYLGYEPLVYIAYKTNPQA